MQSKIALARIGRLAIFRSVFLTPRLLSLPAQGGAYFAAAAIFAAGLVVGAVGISGRASVPAGMEKQGPQSGTLAAIGGGYSTTVLYVNDGDTFEARVRIWPGMDVTTKVRLRGIDASEMKFRCEAERIKALAAREALARMLNQGSVTISNIGQDKYGGRVDADVATGGTPNVSEALLAQGLARSYDGSRRESWCDAAR